MRLFALLNFQHVMAYLFSALLFLVVFGVGLAFSHLRTPDADKRMTDVVHRYRDDLASRNAPFPLVMILIIAGTVAWGFFYILMHGLLGVII
ncbi:MAG: hypothetical protein KFF50_16260 [Desulfatitalea sp.]|nr:hypothetical protein [Desulfatitalea sp.]